MTKTIVFDVNETLLDMAALDPLFDRHFGDTTVRRQWFAQVLLTSMTVTVVGDYTDFAKVGLAALGLVAERRGVSLNDDDQMEILKGMRSLPAHPDAAGALAKLKQAGYRLVTLTNSPPAMVEAQLNNAGLAPHFEAMLSVDKVKTFKPSRAVYDMAAEELGEVSSSLWLVAAHNWDTTGALAAGWRAAFVGRPGMVLGALDREPTVRGKDLAEVAAAILTVDG